MQALSERRCTLRFSVVSLYIYNSEVNERVVLWISNMYGLYCVSPDATVISKLTKFARIFIVAMEVTFVVATLSYKTRVPLVATVGVALIVTGVGIVYLLTVVVDPAMPIGNCASEELYILKYR
jgi:FtsH-binding integral membrane protein